LIYFPVSGRTQLFDLVADPHEQTDVAVERHVEAAALRARMAVEAAPVRTGYQLVVRGGAKDAMVRARLVSKATFHDVALVQPERADRFRMTKGGTVLDVRFRLVPKRLPSRGGDIDGVAFHTQMDVPFVVQRLALDGGPMSLADLWIGNGHPARTAKLPLQLGAMTPGLLVRYAAPPPAPADGRPIAQVTLVRSAGPPKVVVSPEMENQLRAMGYVQ
jgi:hypothetical protein